MTAASVAAVSFTAARDLDAGGCEVALNVLVQVPHAARYLTGGARGGDAFIGRWLARYRPDAEHIVIVPANRSQVDPWWLESHTPVTLVEMPPGTDYACRNLELVRRGVAVVGMPAYPEDDPRSVRSGTWQTIRMARDHGKLWRWDCVKPPYHGRIEQPPPGWRGRGHAIAGTVEAITPAALADAVTAVAGYALAFGRIDRTACLHPDGVTRESDSDHTVMLGWVAPALAGHCDPGLDAGLVAQFALIHDAVEVHAGDTPTLRIDDDGRAAKAAREAAAADRWRTEFAGTLPWLPRMIDRYERQVEPEARFVRAIDKILPKLVHMLNGCGDLASYGMTSTELAGMLARQRDDIAAYAGEFETLMALRDETARRVVATLQAREQATV